MELKKVDDFCKNHGFYLVKSKYKVLPVEKGYSNKGVLDDKGMNFMYISKDEILANKAAYFEIIGDHFNLGITLGYPKCCSLFFQKEFPKVSMQDNNYERSVIKNSEGSKFPFQNNIFRRDDDFCLISHFPCNLRCMESRKIGKKFMKLISSKLPNEAILLKRELRKSIHNLTFY